MKVHNSKLLFTINLLLEWKDVAQTASLQNQEKKKYEIDTVSEYNSS